MLFEVSGVCVCIWRTKETILFASKLFGTSLVKGLVEIISIYI